MREVEGGGVVAEEEEKARAAAEVRAAEDMMADEQALAAGAAVSAPGVPFPLVANPIKLSKAGPNLPRGPAPRLGEHSEAVLSELGLSDDEIRRLRAEGVTN